MPPDSEPIDIFRLLEELEELPEKARHLPFNTLVGFNTEQFVCLVLKIRANLPKDLKVAHRLARDSERLVETARADASQHVESGRVEGEQIIGHARDEAHRIVEDARQKALQMVDRSEVHQMATAQAQEILRRAEVEAAEIRRGADEYAREVLSRLEAVMGKAIVTVQRGRETLDRARAPVAGGVQNA